MVNTTTGSDGAWIEVRCDCETMIVELSPDRQWLRYKCRDRHHGGGKVYSYIDLRRQAKRHDGTGTLRLIAAGHGKVEDSHG